MLDVKQLAMHLDNHSFEWSFALPHNKLLAVVGGSRHQR